ncbi:LPS export ABC transporter periplasmic protein LptC [uncultured Salinisphaera sp.]|uniref:LPS export ABC transporter periplasmic protein LptC n=1 Tax=uncultured Salinisphaera sp. TaxID=359372 RepID=UPI0032B2DE39|tara:strand:+ start:643 stop:1200 length:558 start_codon:yes stop_codon:yes gene_type:complete
MWRYGLALLVVLAVVIGLGRWLGQHRAERQAGQAPVTTPDNSDYYLEDATLYQLDKNGDLAYRAHTVQALHFPNEAARASDITVRYFQGQETPWHIKAKHGRVPAGAKDLYLYDGIDAKHPQTDGETLHVVTDHAWIRPDADQIDTDAHVTASRPGEQIEGDGMRADLAADTVTLLNNVQARYAR